MSPPRWYRSFADFEREYIRPAFKVGQSIEDMIEDSPFEAEFDFDRDPFDDPDEEEDDDY
jgi:hypothetical protein